MGGLRGCRGWPTICTLQLGSLQMDSPSYCQQMFLRGLVSRFLQSRTEVTLRYVQTHPAGNLARMDPALESHKTESASVVILGCLPLWKKIGSQNTCGLGFGAICVQLIYKRSCSCRRILSVRLPLLHGIAGIVYQSATSHSPPRPMECL